MGIASIIAGLIGGILGPLVRWAQRKQEMIAQHQRDEDAYRLQELKNQDSDNVASGKRSVALLRAFPGWLRDAMFLLWLYPFFICQFSTAYALVVFNNMSALPAWYTESTVILMFALMGIPVGANMVNGVFGAVTGYFQNKRDAGYEHEQTLAKINRTAVMDSIQADLGGKLDQKTVDIVNKAINAGYDNPSNDGTTNG